MFFLTELPVIEGSGVDAVTLIAVLLGGGALTWDRFRNGRHAKNNPNSHAELDALKRGIIDEVKETRDSMHSRATGVETKLEAIGTTLTGIKTILEERRGRQ